MQLFLDTASVEKVRTYASLGIIDGVTTNPTHMSKEQENPVEIIKELCALLPQGLISVEVTEVDPAAVYQQARRIAAISENILVKIPCHEQYYSVIGRLAAEAIPLNITLVFSPLQSLCMAKLGVDYVSPFVGRLQDAGGDGIQLVADIVSAFRNYYYETSVLAASLRSIDAVKAVALLGVDAVTIPVSVCEQMLVHPLTDKGIQQFQDDWQKRGIIQFP